MLSRIPRQRVFVVAGRRLLSSNARPEIRTLEDLAKLKSLDDIDPRLISQLINEKTNELNTKNELEMLKYLQAEERKTQEVSLKKFVRPGWIFLLMASFVYLSLHYIWWKLEYDARELELQEEVKKLENELNDLIEKNEADEKNGKFESSSAVSRKSWYKFW